MIKYAVYDKYGFLGIVLANKIGWAAQRAKLRFRHSFITRIEVAV